jgi:hypothetical protein
MENMDGELKWFIAGRAAIGTATRLGPVAFIGDTTRAIENGHGRIDALIKGGVNGQP